MSYRMRVEIERKTIMTQRTVKFQTKGYVTEDGAGVKLVRVLGIDTVKEFDPILMLDSFDSENPDDYTAGFPLHPHRGIETISYVYKGAMKHKDSLGTEDTITDGEVQWMTAGSGILHEEQLPASKKMLGVQLWLNLAAKDKMCTPLYHAIKKEDIQDIPFEGGKIRLLAGNYKDHHGFESHYLPLDYYDIHLESHSSITIETDPKRSVVLFTLVGDIHVGTERIFEKTAVKLTQGESVTLQSDDEYCQILFISSYALDEPVSWGGPIVMNTKKELEKAFDDLRRGTFLTQGINYD